MTEDIYEECDERFNRALDVIEMAVKTNDINLIKNTVDLYKEHRASDSKYGDILMRVIRNEDFDKVKLLINIGYDISKHYWGMIDSGYTPLGWACLRGSLEMVKLLVDAGCNLNQSCIDGHPIWLSLHGPENNFNKFHLLVEKGCDLYKFNIFCYLIKSDGRLYNFNKLDYVPLIRFLMEHGYDINNYLTSWPTDLTCDFCPGTSKKPCSHIKCNIRLRKNIAFQNPLIMATVVGNVPIMKLLIDNGINLNSYLDGQYFMDFISKPNKYTYNRVIHIDHRHLLPKILKIMNKRISLLSQCIFYIRKDIENYRKYFHLLNKDVIRLLTNKIID